MISPAEKPARHVPNGQRPSMPAGYGISAEPQDMVPWDDAVAWLVRARNYWISTTSADGRPYAAPVWGLWLNDALYFSTDMQSSKGRHIVRQPNLVARLESGEEVAILEGEVEGVANRAELDAYTDAYHAEHQFRPDVSKGGEGVYRLRPAKALAWREQDFPRSATRWTWRA